MYTEFQAYIQARIDEVNANISGTADDLFKSNADLDTELLPDNQKDKSWMLKFEEYEEDEEYEANVYNFEAVIECNFLLTNSDTTKYLTVIDNYIQPLVKKIKVTPQYNASSTFKLEVKTVGTLDLNKFEDSVFKPKVKLTGQIIDI